MVADIKLDNEQYEVRIPLDCFEITFEQFCDWQPVEAAFIEKNKAGKVEEAYALLTEAVAVICGPGVHKLPFTTADDRLGPLIDGGYRISLNDDITVLRLYAHLVGVLREELSPPLKKKKLPASLTIDHAGKKFVVNHQEAVRIITQQPLTTGETIEAMEYNRRKAQAAKANNYEASALDFTLGLSVFCILCKQEGERLPAEESKRDRWIEKRRELLRTVSMADVMRVRFFLLSALTKFTKPTSTNFSAKAREAPVRKLNPRRRGSGKRR